MYFNKYFVLTGNLYFFMHLSLSVCGSHRSSPHWASVASVLGYYWALAAPHAAPDPDPDVPPKHSMARRVGGGKICGSLDGGKILKQAGARTSAWQVLSKSRGCWVVLWQVREMSLKVSTSQKWRHKKIERQFRRRHMKTSRDTPSK